ncbi:MAG TPA: DoxX family protein [Buttiauxella sp.]
MIRITEFRRSSVRIAARWLLSLIFLISAVQTVHDFHDTAADLAGKHVPLAGVTLGFAVIAELLGAVSLITGLRYRWGAFILLLFLLPVTVTYHSFWLYEGTRRDAQMVHFLDVHGYLWVSELCKKPLRGKLPKAEFPTALRNPHTPRIPTFRTAPATTA